MNARRKPHISYPCDWDYTLIGLSEEAVNTAIQDIIPECLHLLRPSKGSSGGKYCSFRIRVRVDTEETRNSLFNRLQNHKNIKMVL